MNEQLESVQLNSKEPKDCLMFFNENLRMLKDRDGVFHEFRIDAAATLSKIIIENESLKKAMEKPSI